MRDGALLIDLGGMRDVTFDAETGDRHRSPGGPGRTSSSRRSWSRTDATFTGGHCESVGLGGFLLQGGQGWNSRRWGWGCENVVAIDVVTADGELVRCSDARARGPVLGRARGWARGCSA